MIPRSTKVFLGRGLPLLYRIVGVEAKVEGVLERQPHILQGVAPEALAHLPILANLDLALIVVVLQILLYTRHLSV